MPFEQIEMLGFLALMLGLFVWGRLRYDVVAFGALTVAVLIGLVPPARAFEGFANPAVITVALVLILSVGLTRAGTVDLITRHVLPDVDGPILIILALGALGALLSAFINNVGALALLMPVAVQVAGRKDISPAAILMPLAFATMLGGMTTQIGTPPNILIAEARRKAGGTPFELFDFTHVGLPVALAGLLFVALVGWRLIPRERRNHRPPQELFAIESYVTEAVVHDGSKAIGRTLLELEGLASDSEVEVISLVHGGHRILNPSLRRVVFAGDVLILRADADAIDAFIKAADVTLAGKPMEKGKLGSEDAALAEAVVTRDSLLLDRTAAELTLRSRYHVSLLAVSRRGRHIYDRLASHRFEVGDVALLQCDAERMAETIAQLGCVPLAERGLRVGQPERARLAGGLFAAAVAVAAIGLVPIAVAFAVAAVVFVIARIVPAREVYRSVDWSIVVLIGALIPVGEAVSATGTAQTLGAALQWLAADTHPAVALTLVLVLTMSLSDVMNNAATAVLMAPVALDVAVRAGANPDAFLMAVAIGASCAFLTPIGHQNNALVMGPGGYRFGDYWRMGLPLEVLVVALAIPALLIAWPP